MRVILRDPPRVLSQGYGNDISSYVKLILRRTLVVYNCIQQRCWVYLQNHFFPFPAHPQRHVGYPLSRKLFVRGLVAVAERALKGSHEEVAETLPILELDLS